VIPGDLPPSPRRKRRSALPRPTPLITTLTWITALTCRFLPGRLVFHPEGASSGAPKRDRYSKNFTDNVENQFFIPTSL
jgi:hypothetical protein